MRDGTNPEDSSSASNEPLDATIVDEAGDTGLTNRQAYNVVSDTVVGANLRVKDNLFQAIAIAACMVIGAGIGAAVVRERLPGALVGGFAGLVFGFFGSGIFLMIFRAVKHIRGRHD
ncbi:MAG: hypothetical protein O3C40_24170 [Planctomycetota bacterium]|nr:hypothetical protein [Planctomycetota bacterium]